MLSTDFSGTGEWFKRFTKNTPERLQLQSICTDPDNQLAAVGWLNNFSASFRGLYALNSPNAGAGGSPICGSCEEASAEISRGDVDPESRR